MQHPCPLFGFLSCEYKNPHLMHLINICYFKNRMYQHQQNMKNRLFTTYLIARTEHYWSHESHSKFRCSWMFETIKDLRNMWSFLQILCHYEIQVVVVRFPVKDCNRSLWCLLSDVVGIKISFFKCLERVSLWSVMFSSGCKFVISNVQFWLLS
jgi:hypothetical protein